MDVIVGKCRVQRVTVKCLLTVGCMKRNLTTNFELTTEL